MREIDIIWLDPDTARPRVHYLEKASDIDTMIWSMANFKHYRLSFLQHPPYMVSSEVDFKLTFDDKGTLQFEDSIVSKGLRDPEQCQSTDMECHVDEMDGEQVPFFTKEVQTDTGTTSIEWCGGLEPTTAERIVIAS